MSRIDLDNYTLKSINLEIDAKKNVMIKNEISNIEKEVMNLKSVILNYDITAIILNINLKLENIKRLLNKNMTSLTEFIDNQLKDYEFTEEEAEENVMKQISNLKSLIKSTLDYKKGNITDYNIDASAQEVLDSVRNSWGEDLDPERIELIEKAASLVNKGCKYSQGSRNPRADNPNYLDCSSYVSWAYNKEGHNDVPIDSYTGTFVSSNSFKSINKSDLKPGDIALNNNSMASGNSNHIGIYVGKNSSNQNVYLHCTSSGINGPQVRVGDGNFSVYYGYNNWNK